MLLYETWSFLLTSKWTESNIRPTFLFFRMACLHWLSTDSTFSFIYVWWTGFRSRHSRFLCLGALQDVHGLNLRCVMLRQRVMQTKNDNRQKATNWQATTHTKKINVNKEWQKQTATEGLTNTESIEDRETKQLTHCSLKCFWMFFTKRNY